MIPNAYYRIATMEVSAVERAWQSGREALLKFMEVAGVDTNSQAVREEADFVVRYLENEAEGTVFSPRSEPFGHYYGHLPRGAELIHKPLWLTLPVLIPGFFVWLRGGRRVRRCPR